MIFNFLKRLFCFHVWEYERDANSGEIDWVCRKCREHEDE